MFASIKQFDREITNKGFVENTLQTLVLDSGLPIATEGSLMVSWYYNSTPPPFNPNETPPGPGCANTSVVNGSTFVFIEGKRMALDKISISTCHPSHVLYPVTPSVSFAQS